MRIVIYGNFSVPYCSENHHAKSLEALGHEVIKLQEQVVTTDEVLLESLMSDVLVWIHTHGWINKGRPMGEVLEILKRKNIITLAYHLDLYMPLKERWQQYVNDPYFNGLQHFFITDKLHADWFNENTEVKGHFIPAGVYHEECVMLEPQEVDYDVVFVGSRNYHKEWQYRPKLVDWLRNTYGKRFLHVGGDGDTGVVRGLALNQIYANAKVAVGDTLCIGFDYPYYFSDRLFESVSRGAFTIFPYITGIDDHFEIDKEVVTYKFDNFIELKNKIDYYIEHNKEREAIRKAGFDRAKKDHTYLRRWEQILNKI